MTPSIFASESKNSAVFYMRFDGVLSYWNTVTALYQIRPVINIRSDVLISQGDGTSENPFMLQLA